jgi:mono/diheme cytochrome c family protein
MKPFLLTLSAVTLAAAAPASTHYVPTPNTERLFKVKCAVCHGADGSGGAGASFKVKLAHPTLPALVGVIKNGIPGTAMPGNPSMPDTAVHDLAQYVLYLNKKK